MRLRTLILTSLLTLTVAACGVRGSLEPPPSASPAATPPAGAPAQEQPTPDRPFILDGLLL